MANMIHTLIEKDALDQWYVTYQSQTPVTFMTLKRSVDASRASRWHPENTEFVITQRDDNEIIKRKDGASFSHIRIALTPTYTPLPKEYAPFSPYSDGGLLLHSGRFFVCAQICNDEQNAWSFTLMAKNEHILVDGKFHRGEASWVDIDSGQKVYVGQASLQESSHYYSVVDQALPTELKDKMAKELPKLMAFFIKRLGPLSDKPSLFASFSATENGRSGQQGGTLGTQIFMHWYGERALMRLKEQDIYWFFAHEVAHLYQKDGARLGAREDGWVHEGAAELFAGLLSENPHLTNKLNKASQECQTSAKAAQKAQLTIATWFKQSPKNMYSCGLILMHAIHQEVISQNQDVFSLWHSYSQRSRIEGASARLWVNTVTPFTSKELASTLNQVLKGKPDAFLDL